MLATRKSRLQWRAGIEQHGHQQAFEALFSRRLVMWGDALLRAPSSDVAECIAELAQRRGLPPTDNGQQWKRTQ
eukprot:1063850-Alexandrium_andersonii.AAC.1